MQFEKKLTKELKILLKRDSNAGVSCVSEEFLRSPFLKNICERLLLSDVIKWKSVFLNLYSVHAAAILDL